MAVDQYNRGLARDAAHDRQEAETGRGVVEAGAGGGEISTPLFLQGLQKANPNIRNHPEDVAASMEWYLKNFKTQDQDTVRLAIANQKAQQQATNEEGRMARASNTLNEKRVQFLTSETDKVGHWREQLDAAKQARDNAQNDRDRKFALDRLTKLSFAAKRDLDENLKLQSVDATPEEMQMYRNLHSATTEMMKLDLQTSSSASQPQSQGSGASTPAGETPAPSTTAPSGEQSAPPVAGAKLAPDGNWYVDDPSNPGKYLRVDQ